MIGKKVASHDNWLHVNLAEYPSQFACQTAEVKKVQPYDGCYYCMTHLLMNTKSIIGAIFQHEKNSILSKNYITFMKTIKKERRMVQMF